MSTKVTKKQLEVKIKELQEFNEKLTSTIRQLIEENATLKGRLQVYESVPKNMVDGLVFWYNALAGQQQK